MEVGDQEAVNTLRIGQQGFVFQWLTYCFVIFYGNGWANYMGRKLLVNRHGEFIYSEAAPEPHTTLKLENDNIVIPKG